MRTSPDSIKIQELEKKNAFLEASLTFLDHSIDRPTWFKHKTTKVLEYFQLTYENCSTSKEKEAEKIKILKILKEEMIFLNLAFDGEYKKISLIIEFLKSIDCSTNEIKELMSSQSSRKKDITDTIFTTRLVHTRQGPLVEKYPRAVEQFIELTHWIYAGYLDEKQINKLNQDDLNYLDQKEQFFHALCAIGSFDYFWRAIIEVESSLGKIFNDRHASYFSVTDFLKEPKHQAALLEKIRELNLKPKELKSASRFKESLIKHIRSLDRTKAREIISEALTTGTPLNRLFSFERQTGIGSHFFGDETTSIRNLRLYKAELDQVVDSSEGMELPLYVRRS